MTGPDNSVDTAGATSPAQGGAAPAGAASEPRTPRGPHGEQGSGGDTSAEEKRLARRSKRARWDLKASPYAFVAPFFLFFAAFGLFPLVYTGWTSLHKVQLGALDDQQWAGFHNYARLLDDDFFWNALWNTFTMGVMSTVPQLLLALGIAHLLNYRLRGSMAYRVALLTPYATSVAAAALVFTLLFGFDSGMINWGLGHLGIDPVNWREEHWYSQAAISSIVVWRWTGYNALIYLAAMQAIPHDLYESAALDGASRWRQFIHVTVPMLRPTILFTVVVSTIGATQLFGEPMLFGGSSGYKGGADHQFQTLGMYMYEQGWVNFSLGRASAIAWVMFLLLLVLAALALVVQRLGPRLRTAMRSQR
ncbi:carbohydrate ABC transporter permease [Streptomyces tsukubensis]|uniref:ABC transporter permease n=1 Tax=Streptomyces tsukubensis TaxID=83656 RepID=A0A1V4A6Z4_9ACTN|nr:sugar ABC transporter permease [Streptomyces tsukubensis]OON77015.1 ABC transporter permease [Streptomyces tsukubensis]QFR93745.1 ABC transporter permease subunit [Streptomyces tsukubensis]